MGAVRRLHATVFVVLAMHDIKERLAALGFEPLDGAAEDFQKFTSEEIKKWTNVLAVTGGKLDWRPLKCDGVIRTEYLGN